MELAAAGAVHEGVVEGKEDVFLSAELFDMAAGSQDCDSPWWARLQVLPLLVM